MAKALNFQSIMLTLQHYWAEQGCLIWQPYYSQVGAGTMNPATFLRVLGPEPWNVAYVEPSVRPDDGRYGMNPNRLQQHYQFQVILKPDPGNPQELYLKSLEALGIEPRQHDIRFVEDNWVSPALGAWGLGWEVWLDGQEITQFTYFQQSGGKPLDVVSVEITYGLERIAMILQRVSNFKDIRWNQLHTYGDVNLAAEREHSTYYFEVADVENLRKMYDLFELEANRALKSDLILPAYDYILRSSHAFNILDARGAIGVTERQAFFGRMRDLSRQVADAYVKQRQQLEFPWIDKPGSDKTKVQESYKKLPIVKLGNRAPFLFEIGTEELPAGDLRAALTQLEDLVPQMLANLHLTYSDIKVYGTPRRLVVSIDALQTRQEDRISETKGPPAERAFDADGNPTKAAEGFARSKGLSVDQLQLKETDPLQIKEIDQLQLKEIDQLLIKEFDGGLYVVAIIEEKGKPSIEILGEALPELVASLHFNKSMRWNASGTAFSRPIRWLLAMLGENLIPFSYAGVQSDKKTCGLRFYEPASFEITEPEAYFSALAAQGILLDPVERKSNINNQIQKLAQEVEGHILDDSELLEEVTQLVERPTAIIGSFDAKYLKILPPEVLISVMKKHQRYFPIADSKGDLMPYFVTVRNGDDKYADVVIDGNLQVILARFADADFFIREDLKKSLAEFVPELEMLTYQPISGSMLDKTHHIERLTSVFGERIGLNAAEKKTTERAAALCKADLATNMVVEMTSLQGVMGKYYALNSGESEEVAEAIYEHYLPRNAEDKQPQTKPGLVLGLTDRLVSLAGSFAIGLAPTGTKDPFAQRRTALGLVQNLIDLDITFDLRWGLIQAAEGLPCELGANALQACLGFISGRLRGLLLEQSYRYDVVDAVLAAQGEDPAGTKHAVEELTQWVARKDWMEILPAYSRCVRITRDLKGHFDVDPDQFVEKSESALYSAVQKAEAIIAETNAIDKLMENFLPLIPKINKFFDEVLVMADDEVLRNNRLGILQRISGLTKNIADFSYLEGF